MTVSDKITGSQGKKTLLLNTIIENTESINRESIN